MPIRLNLYAEDQAIEALRRRDPVKRAVLAGLVLVLAMFVWSSTLMFQAIVVKGEITGVEATINSQTNAYAAIINDEKKLADGRNRLRAIHMLATNRFLNGNLLDVLQRTVVDRVQMTRLKVSQTYILHEEFKPNDSQDKRPPRPATVTEQIVLTLNATDTSPNGEATTRFQNALSGAHYFETLLAKTNGFRLTSIGAPQTDPNGQTFTTFTLEAHLPEKTR
ncbi:MAG TPA: hypothetical protein VN873_03400 [Candidatus Angelobacter sp.]|nr:hypothetical protein [Candidatus Angelobacter sp.]